MPITGRHSGGKLSRGKVSAPAHGVGTGEDYARTARVAELRRLVATGRYRVEPKKLAQRILAKAWGQP